MEHNAYTYNDAFQELQLIVSEIESGQINVDELTDKIRRASDLIAVCKAKLTSSEAEVEKLLAKLAQQDNTEDE
ncbi:exodeoxyribonuclease VII small subunit [Sphingobacterium allocomposti]|jgi:exodeoxyribonuclease VII small subunit|uniref:Exodeoxyribonuclease VII small subunit n=1 Tax=Sphingobacterium allocomposti TaxID=415956 RepID=A0A5S5D9S0_9SPHI|nr:exodeoxyribonuclease VII small subunit [Sphingobacterium composti Yoo et al. 2007 non Ten et al. 2007]TYP91816.1 exodeoxyribonuclease VII small subunit [Sphingobacterium composti Yoo et al. 2007 non Ten et al. 2007]HLS95692.1 exodeoxyribonuclease VII small subunit [Sphingobacterium sp.]